MNVTDVPGDQSGPNADGKLFKHEQFKGGWQAISKTECKVDLQLPKSKEKTNRENAVDLTKPEKLELKDKVLDNEFTSKKKKDKDQNFGFKKRKLNNTNCRRIKTDE